MSSTTKKILIAIEIILLAIGIATSATMMIKSFSASITIGTAVSEAPEMLPIEGKLPEGEMPIGEMPVGEFPAGKMPDGEMPGQSRPEMVPSASNISFLINNIIPFIICLLAAYYMFIGYKKPHGNALRYTMLSFAICLALLVASAEGKGFVCNYFLPIAAALIAYISGRLDKMKQNTVFVIIVAVLLAGFAVVEIVCGIGVSLHGIFGNGIYFIIWLLLVNSYIARYKEHKEAGLADKA